MFDTIPDLTDDELLDAWNELSDATPTGWVVGRPSYDERRDEWSLCASRATERLKVGRCSREWTAVAQTQACAVREMTRCLRDLDAGRVPK